MPEKSVWKAAGHVPAKTLSVLLSSAVKTQKLGQADFPPVLLLLQRGAKIQVCHSCNLGMFHLAISSD